MGLNEKEKWGRPLKPFEAVTRQIDYLISASSEHAQAVTRVITESCRVVMAFSIGALAVLVAFAESVESDFVWIMIFPALGFTGSAFLAFKASYISIASWHGSARDHLAKDHAALLNWIIVMGVKIEEGVTQPQLNEIVQAMPGQGNLDDSALLNAQRERNVAIVIVSGSLVIAIIEGIALLVL